MNAHDFVNWLKGFLDNKDGLSVAGTAKIVQMLGKVHGSLSAEPKIDAESAPLQGEAFTGPFDHGGGGFHPGGRPWGGWGGGAGYPYPYPPHGYPYPAPGYPYPVPPSGGYPDGYVNPVTGLIWDAGRLIWHAVTR